MPKTIRLTAGDRVHRRDGGVADIEARTGLWDRLGEHPPPNDEDGWNRAYFLSADTGELMDVAITARRRRCRPGVTSSWCTPARRLTATWPGWT